MFCCGKRSGAPPFQAGVWWAGCDPPIPMGDKSPKATNKKAAQKQVKANTNMQKRNDSIAAKQVVKPKN